MDSSETDLRRRRIVGGLSSVAVAVWDASAATRAAQARGNDQVAANQPGGQPGNGQTVTNNHAATKAATMNFTKGLAKQLAPRGFA
jgi:NAD(P)-dependent dehydrogenase (short-subunit alcohol dehydrogenase family)